uniref:Nucleotidyltransferase domain-containing protein n=1 Tax=Caldimicrobium thiodismutans TaxID=1653476 RepID=A0A832GPA5_9BACT
MYKLKGVDEKLIEALTEHLKAHPAIEFAILFGSQAQGKAKSESDLDIAIYLNRTLSLEEYLILNLQLEEISGREEDLIILNEAYPLLKHQVMKNRKVLFICNFDLYADFREKTIDEY